MIDHFTQWVLANQKDIEHVGLLLSTQLSGEPAQLIEDLTTIEAWNGRINDLLATANAFLDRGRLFYLPNAEGMRESERKATVDDNVADISKIRDILESYSDCIKQRLILGESILRWEKPNATPEYMTPKSAAQIMRGQ